jgi:hypothetical protein
MFSIHQWKSHVFSGLHSRNSPSVLPTLPCLWSGEELLTCGPSENVGFDTDSVAAATVAPNSFSLLVGTLQCEQSQLALFLELSLAHNDTKGQQHVCLVFV